jgi:hypothetical protein
MHFMIFEEFVADPLGELNSLFAFLGLSADGFEFREEKRTGQKRFGGRRRYSGHDGQKGGDASGGSSRKQTNF